MHSMRKGKEKIPKRAYFLIETILKHYRDCRYEQQNPGYPVSNISICFAWILLADVVVQCSDVLVPHLFGMHLRRW